MRRTRPAIADFEDGTEEHRQPLDPGKGKKTDSPQEPPRQSPAHSLVLTQGDACQTSDPLNCK